MPLLDHFRFPRFGRSAAPPLIPAPEGGPVTRLDRLVARQKSIRIPSDLDQRLEALEGEYSAPLYDASAYSSRPVDAEEN